MLCSHCEHNSYPVLRTKVPDDPTQEPSKYVCIKCGKPWVEKETLVDKKIRERKAKEKKPYG